MYLRTLHIKNFRGISEATVEWHDGVNVLIGPNNSGKTAIIDALRLCLGIGGEQRDIWVRRDDYHISPNGKVTDNVEFDLTWTGLTVEEKGVYVDMLVLPLEREAELQLHVRFDYDVEKERTKRPRYWGGEKEGQPISPEILDLLEHVYLGALRDATKDLAPSRGNQLSRLFLKLASKPEGRNKLAKQINDNIRSMPRWKGLLKRGKRRINEHLAEITLRDEPCEVEIDFIETQFRQIVEGLRLQIPIPIAATGNQMTHFGIWQNSLGYNNLIYIATVLGDLLKRRDKFPYASASLLIEEPEAHLHPQLQDVLFRYLEKIAARGIQVFLSSHSPTITAKTYLDSLIVLDKDGQDTTSTPVRRINLAPEQKQLLQRFLDVTKCQLFFAKSIILVEGISEALLLPSFAKALGNEFDLDRNGVEVVNIGGVAFEPFARLFNAPEAERRIGVRCVILTDDDRTSVSPEGHVNISDRARRAKSFEGGLLKVVWARRTLEYELFLSNEHLVLSTYRELHQRTDLSFTGSPEDKAIQFAEKVKANQDKAALAQAIVAKIELGQSVRIQVPDCINRALHWAIKGEWEDGVAAGTD